MQDVTGEPVDKLWSDDTLQMRYRVAFGYPPDVHIWALLCWVRDDYEDDRALPAWVRWWAIDGDGTIRGFHLKPMGWVEKRLWMLGAHGPPNKGVTAVQLLAGVLGTPDEPQSVPEWWMTLRRRPEHLQPTEVEQEPVGKPKRKAKRKELIAP